MSAKCKANGCVRSRLGLHAASLIVPLLLLGPGAGAQPPSGAPGPDASPRESAAIDITGNWVSIVNEDWRWRMVTPPKGDYTSITMLSDEGRAVADSWDPSHDGSCKAYGAAGLMRMPTRLRIGWDSDDVLKIETDAGGQTRLLHFARAGAEPHAMGPASLQGYSAAQWVRTAQSNARRRRGPPVETKGGSLEVTTTNLMPGWLRRNGVPYSDQTVLTEYFDQFTAPNGDDWLVVTTIVEDPIYLTSRFVTSTHFRREPDGSKWHPTRCRED